MGLGPRVPSPKKCAGHGSGQRAFCGWPVALSYVLWPCPMSHGPVLCPAALSDVLRPCPISYVGPWAARFLWLCQGLGPLAHDVGPVSNVL